MIVKLLFEHHLQTLSLKWDCTGSSESTLVKMPHFWKSHVVAHIRVLESYQLIVLTMYLIDTHFNTFANRAEPDQAALVRISICSVCYGNMIRYNSTLLVMTSNFFLMYKRVSLFIKLFIVGGA